MTSCSLCRNLVYFVSMQLINSKTIFSYFVNAKSSLFYRHNSGIAKLAKNLGIVHPGLNEIGACHFSRRHHRFIYSTKREKKGYKGITGSIHDH